MNIFNLTFRGSVLPGYDPEKVKVAFGKYFNIDDRERIDALFCGDSTVLREDLDRKTAAALYVETHKMGLDVVLEKSAPDSPVAGTDDEAEQPKQNDSRPRGMDHEIREATPGRIDQSWPVSRSRPAPVKDRAAPSAAVIADNSTDQSNVLAQQKTQLQQQAQEQELARQAKRDADALAAIDKAEENARQAARKEAQQAALEQQKAKQKTMRLAAKQTADKKAAEAKAKKLDAKALASEQSAQRRADKSRQKREEAAQKALVRAQDSQQKAEKAAAAKQAKAAENQQRAKANKATKLLAAQQAAVLKAEKQATRQQAAEEARQQRKEREHAKEIAAAQSRETHERKLLAKRRQSEEHARQREAQLLGKRQEAERLTAEKADRKRKHAEEFAILEQRKAAERAQREALARAAREKAAREALELEALQAEQRRLEAEDTARVEAEKLATLDSQHTLFGPEITAPAPEPVSAPAKVTSPVNKVVHKAKPPEPAVVTAAPPTVSEPAERPRAKAGPGAPNLYQLRPFRNSLLVQGRSAHSSQLSLTGFMIALVAFVALIALTVRFFAVDPIPAPSAAHAISSNDKDELYLFIANQVLVHDRAGVAKNSFDIKTMGLQQISRPMVFLQNDHLLVRALAADIDVDASGPSQWGLYNCDLQEQRCATAALPPEVVTIDAMTVEPRTGVRYIASSSAGQLFKVSTTGDLLGAIEMKLPAAPTLRLNSGLIYVSSADVPAISVLRPDNQAFGQQLDEILLLPPPAATQQHSSVGDFIWSADSWWVILYNPESLDAGVYRFDNKWNFTGQLTLSDNSQPQALLGWSDKVLVLDQSKQQIQRFSKTGAAEQPLGSESLGTYITERSEDKELISTLWQISLGLLAIVFLSALTFAYLHHLRILVYKSADETGAAPLNEREYLIKWIEPASGSAIDPRVLAMAYLGFSLTVLLLSIALMVSPILLLAIMVLLSGPPVAFLFLLTSPQGHLGTLFEQLLLVDHQSVYHLGEGARIRYRSHFLMIDDVILYTGATLWPVFNASQMRKHVEPLVTAGVKVDITTLAIKLLEAWHPIAKAALIIASCTLAAGLIAITAWY
ncbi:MAG: hypothetical protein V7746_00615 [Halioglobus sp.]